MHFLAGIPLFVLSVLFVTVVMPVWIGAHYATRWRSARKLSAGDERALAELWQTAQRMEARIEQLERVLDVEAPGWRGRERRS